MWKKRFYSNPMFYMAADTGAGGAGTGSGEGNGSGTGESDGAGTGDGDGAGDAGTEGEKGSEKTFTQADLDRIVKDRLDRERKKYEGVDVKEYKKLKADADAKAEAEKTDLEKAQDKIKEIEKEKETTLKIANERLLRAEFKVLAQEKGIKYVDDAFKLADLTTVTVNDDGTVEGLSAALDTLVKEKPFLVEVSGGTGKIDNHSKGDKGGSELSIGQQLANMRKEQAKAQQENNTQYFK